MKRALLAGACIAAGAATIVAVSRGGGDLAVALLSSVVIGAYLTARVPGNATGPALMAFGFAGVLSDLAEALLSSWQVDGFPEPVLAKATAVLGASVFPLVGAMGTTILLIFPTGRAPGRWRWVLWGVLTAGAVGVASGFTWSALQPFDVVVADVLTLGDSQNPAGVASSVIFVPGMPLSLLALGLRYRRAAAVERLQIRWLGLAASVVLGLGIAVNAINRFGGLLDLLATGSLGLLPLAVAVAITRYRLYEIDRIVSRVVAYAVVAILLAGLFAAIAVLPAAIVGTADLPPSLVAISTLAVFALFNPLRRRVQRAVDRRFARMPYEVDQVLGTMRRRAHEELDPAGLAGSLEALAHQTLSPAHAVVWIRGTS